MVDVGIDRCAVPTRQLCIGKSAENTLSTALPIPSTMAMVIGKEAMRPGATTGLPPGPVTDARLKLQPDGVTNKFALNRLPINPLLAF